MLEDPVFFLLGNLEQNYHQATSFLVNLIEKLEFSAFLTVIINEQNLYTF